MIVSFKKSLFIRLITWSAFLNYLDLAGCFWCWGAHSELNVVKQLGTLELNRLWAHVPKDGKPSHPASSASSDEFQFCCRLHSGCLSKSHTFLLLFSVTSFQSGCQISIKIAAAIAGCPPCAMHCLVGILCMFPQSLRQACEKGEYHQPYFPSEEMDCACRVEWISLSGVKCLED